MKKNFTAPSLKVDLFNKELIFQASAVVPTNAEYAKSGLQAAMNDMNEFKKMGIFEIFLD